MTPFLHCSLKLLVFGTGKVAWLQPDTCNPSYSGHVLFMSILGLCMPTCG